MILLYATLLLALLLRGLGAIGIPALADWRAATRVAMGLFFCLTGVAHFLPVRADLITMIPPGFPNPALLVALSGIGELAGGIGLLIPSQSRRAARGLIMLLIAVFPANIYAAHAGVMIAGFRHPALVPRIVMQVAWIVMLWCARPAASRPRIVVASP